MYLASAGFIALTALIVLRAVRATRAPAVGVASGMVVLALLGMLTYNRNNVYATESTLWTDTARKSPGSVRAFINLGAALVSEERYEQAIQVLEKAYEMKTSLPETNKILLSLGRCYLNTGQKDKAIMQFNKAIQARPDLLEAYDNLGWLYFESGMYKEAAEVFGKKIKLCEGDYQAEYNLAVSLMMAGNNPEALEHMKKAKACEPNNYDISYNLALLYQKSGSEGEAINEALAALGLATDQPRREEVEELLRNLGQAN
jgi:tetratricopeptide (TPR) repeat protein